MRLGRTATIVARRFEEIEAPDVAFITCRALDQFMNKVSTLIEWAPEGATLLLFGGDTLRKQLPTRGNPDTRVRKAIPVYTLCN